MGNGVGRKVLLVMIVLFLAVGAIGFFYSLKLPAYKDGTFYQSQYMAISIEPSSQDASKKFHELRDSQLTNKYKTQDYSLTTFFIGVALLGFILLGGNQATSFKSKKKIIFLGIFSALIASGASFFSLMLDFDRGEFPWWADSLGIPIFTQEISQLLFLIVWAIGHFLFLRGQFECGKPIFRLDVLKSNYWLSFIAFISLLLLLDCVARGSFMMIIPGILWIYFYLSLAAGRVNKMSPRRDVAHA